MPALSHLPVIPPTSTPATLGSFPSRSPCSSHRMVNARHSQRLQTLLRGALQVVKYFKCPPWVGDMRLTFPLLTSQALCHPWLQNESDPKKELHASYTHTLIPPLIRWQNSFPGMSSLSFPLMSTEKICWFKHLAVSIWDFANGFQSLAFAASLEIGHNQSVQQEGTG